MERMLVTDQDNALIFAATSDAQCAALRSFALR